MAFYRIKMVFGMGNGKGGSFSMRFQTPVEVASADRIQMANAAQTAYFDTPALFSPDIALGQCRIQGYVWSPDNGGEFQPTTVEQLSTNAIPSVVGTAAGHSLPPQNSFVVSFYSDTPGGRNRGRVYTPPPPEGVSDQAGVISDATTRATWIQGIAEAVEASLIPVDVNHIVHSKTYGTTQQVTAYTGKNRVDTQRRRRTRG